MKSSRIVVAEFFQTGFPGGTREGGPAPQEALTVDLLGDNPLLARFPLPQDQQGSKQHEEADDRGSHQSEIRVAIWHMENPG